MNDTNLEINQVSVVSVGGPVYNLKIAALAVPQVTNPVFVRPCTSDIPVFQAIFQQMEYDVSYVDSNAEIIVDLGANIGLSSIFFAEKYKKSRVFAIEPSSSNFDILNLNAAFNPRISTCQAAIWTSDGYIYIDELSENGVDLGHWAHRTIDLPTKSSRKVAALSMNTLLERYGIHEIDLLKVDIEGAEFDLFGSENIEWLRRVKTIMVETHERFRPGVDNIIANATNGIFQEQKASGENRIFTRI